MSETLEAEVQSPEAARATLTPDALEALERAGFSRRSFLKGAGALIVTFSAAGEFDTAQAQEFGGGDAVGAPPPGQVDSWIAIDEDGSVTAYTGKAELGQGISTAQIQLVSEELSVAFDRVHLIYCDTSITPDQGVTSGSQSTPTNFNHRDLAQAAATARQALLKLASAHLGVAADQLVAANGVIAVERDPSKKVGYGPLLGGKKFEIQVDPKAKRKPASEWTVLGTPAKRPDLPALVAGQFEFVHNVRLPGMLHGRVVRPPAVGSTVAGVDKSSVDGLPGNVQVVVKNNFVGVVAEKPWQAIQAANKLKVTWSPGAGLPNYSTFSDYLRNRKPTRDTLMVDSKDVDQKAGRSRNGRQGHLLSSLPDARIDGDLLRRSRRRGRQGHDLFADAGRLATARERCDPAGAETGKRARDFSPWLRLLRLERRRYGELRRGGAVPGRGKAGEGAAHAER